MRRGGKAGNAELILALAGIAGALLVGCGSNFTSGDDPTDGGGATDASDVADAAPMDATVLDAPSEGEDTGTGTGGDDASVSDASPDAAVLDAAIPVPSCPSGAAAIDESDSLAGTPGMMWGQLQGSGANEGDRDSLGDVGTSFTAVTGGTCYYASSPGVVPADATVTFRFSINIERDGPHEFAEIYATSGGQPHAAPNALRFVRTDDGLLEIDTVTSGVVAGANMGAVKPRSTITATLQNGTATIVADDGTSPTPTLTVPAAALSGALSFSIGVFDPTGSANATPDNAIDDLFWNAQIVGCP